MNKTMKIIIAIAIIVVIGVVLVMVLPAKTETENENNVGNDSSNAGSEVTDLTAMVDKLYEGFGQDDLPMLETATIDLTDDGMVSMLTGLENGNDLKELVVSQPMMNAQAFSVVLATAKDEAKADKIAEEMCNGVDMRRWVCVEAERAIGISKGNTICLIMADANTADKICENFKNIQGKNGEAHVRDSEGVPDDMFFGDEGTLVEVQ